MLSGNKLLPVLKNFCLIIIGTLILAFGTAVFVIPFDLIVGGVSGLSIIISRLVGSEFLSVDLLITILTWTLFFVGLIVLGKSFALKTLISSVVYPIGISLFSKLNDPDMLGGVFYLKGSAHSDIAILIAALFGGVLIGFGCAVTFLGGGSTGGMDILAFTVCKFFKKLRSPKVIFVLDTVVIAFGMAVLRDLAVSLLGIVAAFVSVLVMDKVFLGGSRAYMAQIISDRYEDINRAVINGLERTTTFIDVTGGYSGNKKKMLMVTFTMSQYAKLNSIINSVDKNAFVTVNRAYEINGEGWTK